jgi:UDP-glucuronate decarboxylase
MKILVTGGAGFLGYHLCSSLLQMDHEVIAIDNFVTGQTRNVEYLSKFKNFTFVEQDVTSDFDFDVDQIYNLACPASPEKYQNDPILTVKTNILGSLNVLELARRKNARVLQASTSEVYGNALISPQSEDYWGNVNPIGVRSCYDEGKRVAETLFFDYSRTYKTDIKVMRIFNTYGPNMQTNDGRVVSNFIIQALQGRPITIYGDGKQTRSFCYVSDLISGMTKLMNSLSGVTGPVNIGNPNEITMKELAKSIIRLTESNSKIEFLPLPGDDPLQRKPDIGRARSLLNWEPLVSLDHGLNLTIDYFREIQSKIIDGKV